MPDFYHYENNRVKIPPSAEVSRAFRPLTGAPFREAVQSALNEIEPWEQGQSPIHTFDLPKTIGNRVVKLAANEVPLWGVHNFHKALKPGLSPFIQVPHDDERLPTTVATLELVNTPKRPVLTRVHPGEYTPPLPWMKSSSQAPGGVDECRSFWETHAYVFNPWLVTHLDNKK